MIAEMKSVVGKALTVIGPVEPESLGKVSMHEHLHCVSWDKEKGQPVEAEGPLPDSWRRTLVEQAFPMLKECTEHGGGAFVDTTMPPWRAWPTIYPEAVKATGFNIVLCTGYYREIELGKYWAAKPEWQIWSFAREGSVEELEEYCVREITQGINGTEVRAGAIKLGSSGAELTATEEKTFRAGARAQKQTGVHITTHCTDQDGAFAQMRILDEEGVDPNRVAIGHIGWCFGNEQFEARCLPYMKRGYCILPTNLGIGADGGEEWRSLVEGIHRLFDAGVGSRLGFGLDWAFCADESQSINKDGSFGPCNFIPPPPYLHMYTHTLPALRKMGLTEKEEDMIMRTNPQRIIPVAQT